MDPHALARARAQMATRASPTRATVLAKDVRMTLPDDVLHAPMQAPASRPSSRADAARARAREAVGEVLGRPPTAGGGPPTLAGAGAPPAAAITQVNHFSKHTRDLTLLLLPGKGEFSVKAELRKKQMAEREANERAVEAVESAERLAGANVRAERFLVQTPEIKSAMAASRAQSTHGDASPTSRGVSPGRQGPRQVEGSSADEEGADDEDSQTPLSNGVVRRCRTAASGGFGQVCRA